jgi:tetratricopeptide (TPR) repeat protein
LKIPDVPDPGVMRSKALSFIISFPHYNSNERDVDERIKTILSSGKNAEIRELLDVVYQARTEGKMPSGFADSPRFMFPVTLALADGGYFETAENLVMRSEHAEADPFYNFIRHRIECGRKNYGLSKKFLSRAMHSLTNFQFLQDSVFLGLLTEDGGMLDSLNSIEQNGWAPYFSTERLYRTVKESGKWGSIVTILDKLTSWGVTNHYSLRLSRDYLISKGDLKGALASSASIFRIPGYSIDDVKIHLDILDRNGNGMDKYPFLDDVEADHMVPYAHVIHGDLLFSQGKMHDAIIHYDLAAKAGIDLKGNRNFATALIDSGRENEAVDLLGKIDDPYLLIRVYHKQHKIQESIQILRKYAESAGDYTELYTFAAQNLWYNRDVRDTLMEIFNEHGHLFLGKIIARNLFEQGESESAVRILGNISKNYPQNLEIKRILIDTMVKGGMRDEAIALILNNLPQFKDYREQMDLIRTLYYLYFQDRDYEAVTKFYQTNPDYIDSEILQYIVRSYIELEDFDTAERVISRYEGTALPRDMHSELMENLNFKKEFVETMFFVSKLFKAEYKE